MALATVLHQRLKEPLRERAPGSFADLLRAFCRSCGLSILNVQCACFILDQFVLFTVKLHRKHAYAKLEVSSQAELFYLFLDSVMSASDYNGGDPLLPYLKPVGA